MKRGRYSCCASGREDNCRRCTSPLRGALPGKVTKGRGFHARCRASGVQPSRSTIDCPWRTQLTPAPAHQVSLRLGAGAKGGTLWRHSAKGPADLPATRHAAGASSGRRDLLPAGSEARNLLDSPAPYRGAQFLIAANKLKPGIANSLETVCVNKRKDGPFPPLRVIPRGRFHSFVLQSSCSQRKDYGSRSEHSNEG